MTVRRGRAARTGSPSIRSTADPRARGKTGDRRLTAQLRRGDRRARALMIERYLPFAAGLALRYRHNPESAEDLVQVASVGLVKAVDGWDPDRGVPFSTYAAPTILGELRRYFRDKTWHVRPPRRLQELALAVERARAAFRADSGREPTVAELAGRLCRSPAEIEEALQAGQAHIARSLDAPTREGGEVATLADRLGCDDADYEQVEARATIAQLASVLDDRARTILRLRYEHDLKQSEIAERVGYSQMYISRSIRHSLDRMALCATVPAPPPPPFEQQAA